MRKKYLILIIIFLISSLNFFGLHYYSKDFYFSIDVPDSWELADDSKKYNAFFRNDKKDSYAEVTVFDLKAVNTNDEMISAFVKRFNMTGSSSNTVFCKYKAVKGEYSFNVNGLDLMMNLVVFKDNYYYYVVMGYANKDVYKKTKSDVAKIVQSVKIYYDNNVVYGNDGGDTTVTSDTETNNKNNDVVVETKSGKTYNIRSEWDNYKKEFTFMQDDYNAVQKEVQKIVDPSIWGYFNIDPNSDSDYNFSFWKKFYQEMYNKNFTRVTAIVQWFKDEAKKKGWSSYDLATNVMKFIQVIPYERPFNVVTDKTKGANILDYFTPNEVAYYDKGDCDTKSMFMVMILRQLGYDACIYYSYSYGHAMVGLNMNAAGTYTTFNNKKYYFIESTYPGWKIGDLPPQMNDTSKWRLIPIK